MVYLGLVLVAMSAIGFLVLLHVRFWKAYYTPEVRPDEIHFARTSDGWQLALHRYRGTREGLRQPVLLCHGLGANRFNLDLDADHSLARFLNAQGWDVWILELRGAGMSSRPHPLGQYRWGWTFDDHLLKDLPAAIDYVCDATDAPALHGIGHSMSGMLMLVHAQTAGASRLRSITALGATPFFERDGIYAHLPGLASLLTWMPSIPGGSFSRLLGPFAFGISAPFITHNGAHVSGHTLRRSMMCTVENLCSNLVRQIMGWVERESFDSADGDVDYRAGLSVVRTPLLMIAGGKDKLAPAAGCRRVVETVGSSQRRFRLLDAYGHGDLLIGEDARVECFPLISEWLELRADDALPPPMPDALVSLEAEGDLDLDEEADDDHPEDRAEPMPLEAPTLEGPYGLLNRFSPWRRQRWFEEREAFREAEAKRRRRKRRLGLRRSASAELAAEVPIEEEDVGIDVETIEQALSDDVDVDEPPVLVPDEILDPESGGGGPSIALGRKGEL